MKTNKLWFRAKTFGLGWYPVSWQGWALTLLYVAVLLTIALNVDPQVHSGSDFLLKFGTWFVIITVPFLAICWLKGEKPRWRWGRNS